MQDDHLSDVRFEQLNLDPRLLANLQTLGFDRCTPIQAKSLPLALAGRDVAGQAQTGTGKTAAFAIPMLQILHEEDERPRTFRPRALVLAPTRELALQIKDACVAKGVAMFILADHGTSTRATHTLPRTPLSVTLAH